MHLSVLADSDFRKGVYNTQFMDGFLDRLAAKERS
jgi:hypothetical protein